MNKASKIGASKIAPSQQLTNSGNPEVKLKPPYLRYNVPAERVKIDAAIMAAYKNYLKDFVHEESLGPAAIIDKVVAEMAGDPVKVGDDVRIRSEAAAKLNDTKIASRSIGKTKNVEVGKIALQPEPTNGNKVMKVAGSVVPSGVVEVGWHCPTEFRADCSTGQTSTLYTWWIECGPNMYFLDGGDMGKIYFELDGDSYQLAPQASSGSAVFTIHCDIQSRSIPKFRYSFAPITLSFFTQTPCVKLAGATLVNETMPCQLKGDDHGARPRIKVELTAPAGPSGQKVFLILDDPHTIAVARWINGVDNFTIPFGQTSGELEGFLGTRKVTSRKTISIRARVNGQESQPLTMEVNRK